MNFQEPYRIHQINLSNIVYTKVKTTETKKLVFIKYEDNIERRFKKCLSGKKSIFSPSHMTK